MKIKIEGRLIEGTSSASTMLPRQWPELVKHVPEMNSCFQGTLNVELTSPLLIINPDRVVPPFEWEPGHIEGIGIVEIKFEWPVDTEPFQAWVYLPRHSFNRYSMVRAEVITKEIPRLREKANLSDDEMQCRLHYLSISGFII